MDQDQELLKVDIVKQNFENDASHATINSSYI
jgi:hypothetical protein